MLKKTIKNLNNRTFPMPINNSKKVKIFWIENDNVNILWKNVFKCLQLFVFKL